ncbi:hypothetical protein SKDZ_12G1360 [Saccharomyces kudriavzevii ZP591]|nr:hypothetical protein SKDZ_12G1360 [Saccharomyces kudriavzevii ZP591]
MCDSPLSKKQKRKATEEPELSLNDADAERESRVENRVNRTEKTPDPNSPSLESSYARSHTPRKLVLSSGENRYAFSQPTNSATTSLHVPNLQPPKVSSRGRDYKAYSQSPPRSPGRSPARRLELLQLSPVKNSRIELQKLYDSHKPSGKQQGRLFINKLVLDNFKSYAGRQVVGPFHTSFSAVVGPNGSGKSNVIDSMLFVFGFRANKMRQDRLSDLIHKSEAFPDLQACSVAVHFEYIIDEPSGTSRIDEEKPGLVITRRAFKNNSSKYYINEKESSYTEVTKLLKKEGIDLDHKRFLILQGEVENIAQMKPKAEKESDDGLLEYLEDIIGTANYKPLIEERLSQIENLNEICLEKANRFEIVDREKNSLESGKETALEFLKKEKQLTLLKSKLLQFKVLQSNSKLASTLEKISSLNREFESEKKKFQESLREVDEVKAQHKDIKDRISSSTSREKTLSLEKRELEGSRVSLEERTKNLVNKMGKAEKALKSTKHSISESEHMFQELQGQQTEHEKEIKDLNQSLEEERIILDDIKLSLKDKTKDISAKIIRHEKESEPWDLQLQEKKSQIQLAESELSLLEETRAKLKKNAEALEEKIISKKQRKQELQGLVLDLSQRLKSLIDGRSQGEKDFRSAHLKLKEMQRILNAHRQRAMEARSSLSKAQNKNMVLTALSKLQKSGRINGFHGRLGDLGVIDNSFDVAISTACPRLDDVVVDTVECAQHCIDYLRKNKLGYARFILLDRLRKFNLQPISTPENVPRLFDVVKPKDPKFSNAFYSVLKDTLVARDLKQANKVAYGKRRFRVVTVDGKLIDISGTMSGGGNHVMKGLMRLGTNQSDEIEDYTPEEVIKIEHELAEREKNFRVANDTVHEMEEELKKVRDQEPDLESQISRAEMEADSLTSELMLAEQQAKEAKMAYDKAVNEKTQVNEVMKNLEHLRGEYEDLQSETRTKKEQIKILQDQIMKIGGTKLHTQNSKVGSLCQRIDILVIKLKKVKSGIKKSEGDVLKYQKQLKNFEQDVELSSNELKVIEEKLKQTKLALTENDTNMTEISNLKSELKDQGEQLKERLTEMEENIDEFKSLEIEMKNKLEKLNSLLIHTKNEIKQQDKELNDLSIRDVTHTLQMLDNNQMDVVEDGIKDEQDADQDKPSGIPDDEKIQEKDDADNNHHSMNIDEMSSEISRGIPKLCEEELKDLDIELLESDISGLTCYINETSVDIGVLEEYVRRLIEFKRRKLDLNQAVQKRDEVKEQLEILKKNRFDEFMNGFNIISMTLKEMYQMITMGGNAELELVDSLDPFSEGVTFSVMPPKKSWRNITNLSGGEKTLSSLALVFALHKYRPTPLYVMDEIDAALDFRNVSIVANYIKERTKNAQFIVISLRNNMFELAQQLIGIYKRDNRTKSTTVKNIDILKRD